MLDLIDLPQEVLDDWYPPSAALAGCCKATTASPASSSAPARASSSTTTASSMAAPPFGHQRRALLRGCYADRAEMRSTFRALTTEGRFK